MSRARATSVDSTRSHLTHRPHRTWRHAHPSCQPTYQPSYHPKPRWPCRPRGPASGGAMASSPRGGGARQRPVEPLRFADVAYPASTAAAVNHAAAAPGGGSAGKGHPLRGARRGDLTVHHWAMPNIPSSGVTASVSLRRRVRGVGSGCTLDGECLLMFFFVRRLTLAYLFLGFHISTLRGAGQARRNLRRLGPVARHPTHTHPPHATFNSNARTLWCIFKQDPDWLLRLFWGCSYVHHLSGNNSRGRHV